MTPAIWSVYLTAYKDDDDDDNDVDNDDDDVNNNSDDDGTIIFMMRVMTMMIEMHDTMIMLNMMVGSM